MTCCRASLDAAGDAQLVSLDGHLDLELLILDVLVDLLGGRLVDTFDDMAEHANGAAARGLRIVPLDGLDVDTALDELGRKDVDDLAGDEIGRRR